MNEHEVQYFRIRSRQEAKAAIDAVLPQVARVHLEMAARYAVRAQACELDGAVPRQPDGSNGSGADEDSFRRNPQFERASADRSPTMLRG